MIQIRLTGLISCLLQVEDLGPPSDGRDVTGEVDPSVHGTSGLVGISPQSVTTNLDPFVIGTTSELAEFPFNEDANSGNTIGVGESARRSDSSFQAVL